MLKSSHHVCLFCRIARPSRGFDARPFNIRQYQTLEKRLPRKNELAKLGRSNSAIPATPRPSRRRQDGPFGGMNLREARIPEDLRKRRLRDESRTKSNTGRVKGNERKDAREGFHALKMQRTLASSSYAHRAEIKDEIGQIDSFDGFNLLPIIKEAVEPLALPGLVDIKPTPVQKVAIPALLGEKRKSQRRSKQVKEKEEFLIAAETGSGKTLAYLLPTVDAIKRAEAIEKAKAAEEEETVVETNPFALPSPPLSGSLDDNVGRPRAIILLPTAELVDQVGALAKALSHKVKYGTAVISASYSSTVIRNRLYSASGVDVVVSTPHILSSIAEKDPNIFSRVTHLVIDEADSLLDRAFSSITSGIIDRTTPSLKQLILCSATIPLWLNKFLQRRFPDIRRLTTPQLHAIPRRIRLNVVDVENQLYRGNKNLACADTIWTIGNITADQAVSKPSREEEDSEKSQDVKKSEDYLFDDDVDHEGDQEIIKTSDTSGSNKGVLMAVQHIIVFVNEREKAKEVCEYLVKKGVDAVALTRDTAESRGSDILAGFKNWGVTTVMHDPQGSPGMLKDNQANYVPFGQEASPVKRKLPGTKVLVTTDLGSRGIDTVAVRHVILYDVPHSTADFVHRLGRTGRMGRRGKGWVLVGKHDRKDVIKEVREAMFRGQALI